MGSLNNHLHYGGSLGKKTGKLGAKPQLKNTFRSQKRYETIVRLENAAFPDVAIAAMLCISPTRLQTIKKSPEYLAARIQLTHGIILDSESKVAQIKEQRKEMLTQLLPSAMQVLANELQRPAQTLAERKHQVALAQDWMDREGTFAKVSRTEIKPVDAFDFEKADAESMAVIAALRGAAPAITQHSQETVDANNQFSNSHTLSLKDQQKSLDDLESDSYLLEAPVSGKVN